MPPNHTKFSPDESQAMKTDKQIYTLLSADPDFLRLLTGGIAVRGAYQFEALSVKGLERHTDGVLIPRATTEGIWVIEFQAQHDPLIYHRLLTEIALVGERHPTREVRGCLLFADATLDPRTEPWHGLIERDAAAPPHSAVPISPQCWNNWRARCRTTRCWGSSSPTGKATWNACAPRPRRSIVAYKRPTCRRRPAGTAWTSFNPG